MEILSERHEVKETWYEHQFQHEADPVFVARNFTSGYAFKVDKKGNLLNEAQRDTFNRLSKHPGYIDLGVQEIIRYITEPAIGKCVCGAKVHLNGNYMGATECECDRWYGMDGTEMNPPDMWEEPIEED